MVAVSLGVLAGTVAADPVERRMPSGDEVAGYPGASFASQMALLRHHVFRSARLHPKLNLMKLLPFGARLAAYGVLAWGLVTFVLVVFVAMAWAIPTVLDWFMLLGTIGAGVALVRRKDPRWAAGIGGVMATIGIYLGLTGRSGGDIPLGEQLRPLLDAGIAWWGFVLNGVVIMFAGVLESIRQRSAALEPNRPP
jgi:hypothetical protein